MSHPGFHGGLRGTRDGSHRGSTAAEDALLDERHRLAPGWIKVLVIQAYA
jgi:hypothetical protein